jgi:hypothetical protein
MVSSPATRDSGVAHEVLAVRYATAPRIERCGVFVICRETATRYEQSMKRGRARAAGTRNRESV